MMPDQTPAVPVEVTQADRDAAADFLIEDRGAKPNGAAVLAFRDGQEDTHHFVQAFARHRLAHSPTAPGVPRVAGEAMVDHAYMGAFLREFAKLVPGVDLRSAFDAGEGFLADDDRNPIEDARSEADEWRAAS